VKWGYERLTWDQQVECGVSLPASAEGGSAELKIQTHITTK